MSCKSIAVLVGLFFAAHATTMGTDFALHNGDRVVFYGDSITDNGPYTTFVEAYTVTRFPNLDVRFFNAGVGGDRVTGGWMGPIDQRMTRDLFSRKPTVITSMLGMNDGSYKPFDQGIFDTYRTGYQHMADRIKKEAPSARVYLIEPSPFDDITRSPSIPGGYNDVLKHYGEYVSELAKSDDFNVVDLNTPVDTMLETAKGSDPNLAAKIIPDRVHPRPSGHLIMAEAVLKAWGAPAAVSTVDIDAKSGVATVQNATVSAVKTGSTLTWTTKEGSLPFPLNRNDAETKLVLASSDFDDTLNQETLKVRDLVDGTYKLSIDGIVTGAFNASDLATGINLAKFDTPMNRQANEVLNVTNDRTATRYFIWRQLEFGLASLPVKDVAGSIRSYERAEDDLIRLQHKAAQPQPHTYTLSPA